MKQIARRITKRIAKQLVQNKGNDDRTVKDLFLEGISNISKPELRNELQANVDKYCETLKRYISRYTHSAQECSSTQGDSTNAKQLSEGTKSSTAQNIAEDSHKLCIRTFQSLQKIPCDDIDQQMQIFDNNLSELSKETHKLHWTTLFDRLIVISNSREIKKILNIYLRKLAPLVDGCLKKQKPNRAKKLFDHLKFCLTVLMTRHHENVDKQKSGTDSLQDLVASLMSLYLDLSSVVTLETTNREIVGFINYVLKQYGANCLDVLLQQTSIISLPVIVKFARFCLATPPVLKDSAQYLRYILCVTKFKDELPEIFESARNVPAPRGFLVWMRCQNRECVTQMPNDRKFKGREITKFLLFDVSESLNTLLLDVLTEDVPGKQSQESDVSYINTEPTVPESLKECGMETSFYVDRKGKVATPKSTVAKSLDENGMQESVYVDRKGKTTTTKSTVAKSLDESGMQESFYVDKKGKVTTKKSTVAGSLDESGMQESFYVDKKGKTTTTKSTVAKSLDESGMQESFYVDKKGKVTTKKSTVAKSLDKSGMQESLYVDKKGKVTPMKSTVAKSLDENGMQESVYVDRKRKTTTTKLTVAKSLDESGMQESLYVDKKGKVTPMKSTVAKSLDESRMQESLYVDKKGKVTPMKSTVAKSLDKSGMQESFYVDRKGKTTTTKSTVAKSLDESGMQESLYVDKKGKVTPMKSTVAKSLDKNGMQESFYVDRKIKTTTTKSTVAKSLDKSGMQESLYVDKKGKVTPMKSTVAKSLDESRMQESLYVDKKGKVTPMKMTDLTSMDIKPSTAPMFDDITDDVEVYEVDLTNIADELRKSDTEALPMLTEQTEYVSSDESIEIFDFNPDSEIILESKIPQEKLSSKKTKPNWSVSPGSKRSTSITIDFTDDDDIISFPKLPTETISSIFGRDSLSEVEDEPEVSCKKRKRNEDVTESGTPNKKIMRKSVNMDDILNVSNGPVLNKVSLLDSKQDLASETLDMTQHLRCKMNGVSVNDLPVNDFPVNDVPVNDLPVNDLPDNLGEVSPIIKRQDEETFSPPVSFRTRSIVPNLPDLWSVASTAESQKQTQKTNSSKASFGQKEEQNVSETMSPSSRSSQNPVLPKAVTLSPSCVKDSSKNKIASLSPNKNSSNIAINSPLPSKKTPKTKILSQSPNKESPKTKILSQSPKKELPKTKILSQSPNKESPKTKILSQSPNKESLKTKILSQSPNKESPKTKIRSPSPNKESPKTKILSQSPNKESPKTKIRSPNKESPKTKILSQSPNKESPKTKIRSPSPNKVSLKRQLFSPHVRDTPNKKKTDSQSSIRKFPKKILTKERALLQIDQHQGVLDSKDGTYSLRNRCVSVSSPRPGIKHGVTEATHTKQTRVLAMQCEIIENEVVKQPGRRKSQVTHKSQVNTSGPQKRRYSLRTRTKPDN